MFLNDLVEFMTADSSVNALITGGMVHPHLPVNFNSELEWVVFEYSLIEDIGTFGQKSVLSKYELSIQIISKDILAIENICNAIQSYIIIYPNEWGIDAYRADETSPDFDSENQVYYKTIKYQILY